MSDPIRLNIGAGATVIPGWTAIDRRFGTEAFPLNYPDNSVEEIRAAHLLEHFSFAEIPKALEEWKRVLKPGGRLRVAVPDFRKIVQAIDTDPMWPYVLMGGQTGPDDFHKSAFDEPRLAAYLKQAGLVGIQHWESPNTDTASHPLSLNLEAIKPQPQAPESQTIKIKAVMSLPRIGWNDAWQCIADSLRPFKIPISTFNGVFWGQCMQRAFQDCLTSGVDWILAIDYDSMFTAEQLDRMLHLFGSHPEIDALAPLQMRRGQDFPLLTRPGSTEVELPPGPLLVTTAHFGCTLLRTECLRDVAKPWFVDKPDANGDWSDDRQDADIYFWHAWRKAGHNIHLAHDVRIGHLQLMVSEFNEEYAATHTHIREWRTAHGMKS